MGFIKHETDTEVYRDIEYGWHRRNVWTVESDEIHIDPLDIIRFVFGSGDPARMAWTWGEDTLTDRHMLVERISCKRRNKDESRKIWIVVADYVDFRSQHPVGRNRKSAKPQEPWDQSGADEPQDVTWSGSFFQTEEQDTLTSDQQVMHNSAETMMPPIVNSKSYSTVICSYSTKNVDPLVRKDASGAFNESVVAGWPFQKHEVKLNAWDMECRYFVNDQPYFYSRLEFHIKKEPGWVNEVANAGPVEIASAGADAPEDRYETIGAMDSTSAIIPSTNVLLTQPTLDPDNPQPSGVFKDDQTKEEKLSFNVLRMYDLNKIWPGGAPKFPGTTEQ
jgi:hypothetical protein